MRPSGRARLDTLGGLPRSSAWLFCGLVLVVCGERRLADHRYNLYNLARADAGIENAETLDGDAVALRLIALDDASPCVLTTVLAAAPQPLGGSAAPMPRSCRVELPPLRAPPSPLTASV